ncbi:tubulin-like doman-containing protein [Corynebacterium mayonis]|uniref:tubulin-like doman-containing protein n=1 Tax=Corynebacterium mayonis TaxID=3062461 RepID=UPI00314023EF
MYKILAVGCGGSGAKSLSFMMDQLKTTLAEDAPEWFEANGRRLPAAWQFVLVDVPTQPEEEKAVPNVPNAGGRYISTGSSAGFSHIDKSVMSQLGRNEALSAIATWAYPNPENVTVPVDAGAGQYRGVGRMLILSKLRQVADQLEAARNRINSAEAASELDAIRSEMGQGSPKGEQAADPVTFVVSSMAGGAGASMALDVCRLLSGLGLGNFQGRSALFMVTPDIFKKAGAADDFIGTSPNTLALFGELAAAQLGQGTAADRFLYEGLGYNANLTPMPVSRVMPVGMSAGTEAVPISDDANPSTVYRALGRGLAALTTDTGMMNNFVQYQLGNPGSTPFNKEYYGWGADNAEADAIPWGSFGYARLAMGRDRYAEYSAQRLAYSAVKRVVEGYKDPNNPGLSDDEQLRERLDKTWLYVQRRLGDALPLPNPNTIGQWRGDVDVWLQNIGGQKAWDWAQQCVSQMQQENRIPSPNGRRAMDWITETRSTLVSTFNNEFIQADLGGLEGGSGDLYRFVHSWATGDLQRSVLEVLSEQIANFGIAYGAELLADIRRKLENPITHLSQNAVATTLVIPQDMDGALATSKSKLHGDDQRDRLYDDVKKQLFTIALVKMGRLISEVLADFSRNFLSTVMSNCKDAYSELNHDRSKSNDPDLGVAQTKTDVPRLWPQEETADTVPSRFSNAANEVMVTSPKEYPERFKHDVIGSTHSDEGGNLDYTAALEKATKAIIHGEWNDESDSEKAPKDLLVLVEPWLPKVLSFVPDTGELVPETSGRVALKIRSGQILDRARRYVQRNGYSFERFINQSLKSFLLETQTEQEREAHRATIAAKFEQAMTKSLPLAQINEALLKELYPTLSGVKYKFNFSSIPFLGDKPLADRLIHIERNYPNADYSDAQPLSGSLVSEGEQRAIDIYGAYPNYLPVVFDSILPDAAKEWDRLTMNNARQSFWQMRRARPIGASIPMSKSERLAMIRGWYVGRLVGSTIFPGEKDRAEATDPIHVFDPKQQKWAKFDMPLLTPPAKMRYSFDWLPAILESVSMAWAKAPEAPQLHSLDPYLALRRNWDTRDEPQDVITATRGYDILRAWLFNGDRVGAEMALPLMIPGTDPSVTPQDRLEASKKWLQEESKRSLMLVSTKQLPGHFPPTSTKRTMADIADRETAMKVPLLIDISLDVHQACEDIMKALDEALKAGPPIEEAQDSGGLYEASQVSSKQAAQTEAEIDDLFGSGF